MFLQGMIKEFVENADTKLETESAIRSHVTPRVILCFLIGYQLYYRSINLKIRRFMDFYKPGERVYANMLISSKNSFFTLEKLLITGGILSSFYALKETNNPVWILGSSLMLGEAVYDYFMMRRIAGSLEKLKFLRKLLMTDNELMHITQQRLALIEEWKEKYKFKIILSLAAIVAIYIAELTS